MTALARPVAPSLDTAAVGLGALAVLVYKLRGERNPVVELRGAARQLLCRIPLEIEPARPAAALLEPVRAGLAAVDARDLVRSSLVSLCWHEQVGHADGDCLELEVVLETLALELEDCRQEGLVALEGPWMGLEQAWKRAVEAVRAGSTAVCDVLLPGDAELAQLERWSLRRTAPQLLGKGPLHGAFLETARRHPDRVAVEHGARSLTYRALDELSNGVAWALRAQGVRPGDFVAVRMPRSIELVAAQLGALKAGAAYVPLDPEWPRDRVEFIVGDAGIRAALVDGSWGFGDVVPSLLRVDQVAPAPAFAAERGDDGPCYAIYTSGTTGRPKGVRVSHRAARHLVEAEREQFAVEPSDRVFQGFSPAFDASVEELWLALASGATLVVGDKTAMVGDFAGLIAALGATVVSTVPTLLSTSGPLPSVRLLIVGGEACPAEITERFATPTCRLYNTWGPTEATVIATCGELLPGAAVTIGTPIANTWVGILDDDLLPVPAGAAGQLYIGGVCLADGYIGRPELTAEKFLTLPPGPAGRPERLYATGDRARYDDTGNIEFLGRLDGQVKLRGFRIELGEVEAALARHPSVAQAVLDLRKDAAQNAQLVAWVVQRAPRTSAATLKAWLRQTLPPYMVPALIETLDVFPVLTSGKVDRRALRVTELAAPPVEPPGEGLVGRILSCWRTVLGAPHASAQDDFFLDLGGHSLLAARAVSLLREVPELKALSVAHVYQHPTAARLARFFGHRRATTAELPVIAPPAAPPSSRALAGLAQGLALYPLVGLHGLQWLAPYLVWSALDAAGAGTLASFAAALAALALTFPAMLLVAVAAKWLVVGRYRAGRYPLWGGTFLRWWFVRQVVSLAPVSLLRGTPLLNLWLRAMGARVHPTAHVRTDVVGAFDLLELGAGSTVEDDASVSGAHVEGGVLHLAPVSIGADCRVGVRSVICGGATLRDGAVVGPLALVPAGAVVGASEHWAGSPARPAAPEPRPERTAAAPSAAFSVATAGGLLVLPLLLGAALLPGLWTFHALSERGFGLWLAAPVASLLFTLTQALLTVALKWLLLGRVRPGRYPVHGAFAWRKWVFDQFLSLSLDLLGSLYATLYLVPWIRLLGARIGRDAEVSTATSLQPDLLEVKDGAFVADAVSLGAPAVDRGVMSLARTVVGRTTFVGNSAVISGGATLGEDCLVGCLSVPPDEAAARLKAGSSWLGSPAVPLPRRQQSAEFSADTTFRPPPSRVALRLLIEAVRVLAPGAGVVVFSSTLIDAALAVSARVGLGGVLVAFPLLYVACALPVVAATTAAKWALVGRYRPAEHPLWSHAVWRAELATALQENLAESLLLDLLTGTPFLPPFYRLLGARFGRGVYLGSTEMTEYDLIDVGDEACINPDATLQTHLFEDRVMKMSRVTVGARCTVGESAVVLYDTRMGEGSSLGAASLLMKGEDLPPGSAWAGSPAQAARRSRG